MEIEQGNKAGIIIHIGIKPNFLNPISLVVPEVEGPEVERLAMIIEDQNKIIENLRTIIESQNKVIQDHAEKVSGYL